MVDFSGILFDEEYLYDFIRDFAEKKSFTQTLVSLPFAAARHKGQYRDNKVNIPYIIHPMQMAFHAIALGLHEDELLATALLHDVCEDCGVDVTALPVSRRIQKAVGLLTKDWQIPGREEEERGPNLIIDEEVSKQVKEQQYYEAIATDPIAAMVKLLDRCNNVSSMAAGFSGRRIERYLKETETFYQPLISGMLEDFPQYRLQIQALCYQIYSVGEALERMLRSGTDG
ncbi:MAG: HD domain-containing protein [Lachnospiraceae bacterium]|nr:HD domain-containing protein [Lachnospiraceae bacterium]